MAALKFHEKLAWRLRRWILARPRPHAETQPLNAPLVVAGFFRTASGVGESARRCADSLEAHGLSPIRVDVSETFDQVDFDPPITLCEMPNTREGTLILHVNAPEMERALFDLQLWRSRHWRSIGYWAWELPEAPPEWSFAARYLSELWTPSEFVSNAFRKTLSVPVKTVPIFVPVNHSAADRKRFGFGENEIIFLAAADGRSSFERKNPLGAIRAFQKAFPDHADVRLLIKTRNLSSFSKFEKTLQGIASKDKRISILDKSLSADEMAALMASIDVFISLHRAEGFGLPIAEAMAAGKPVVATGWSGVLEFLDEQVGMVAPYALTPVTDPFGVYASTSQWAEPDEAAAAAQLRQLADDATLRRRLGDDARTRIEKDLNGAAYSRALSS